MPSDLEKGFIAETDPTHSVLGRLQEAAAAWEAGGGEAQASAGAGGAGARAMLRHLGCGLGR